MLVSGRISRESPLPLVADRLRNEAADSTCGRSTLTPSAKRRIDRMKRAASCSRPPFRDTQTYDPPAELPQWECGGGFARTSASSAKCRSNLAESMKRWTEARSSWLRARPAWSSQQRASSPTLQVVLERSMWEPRSLRTDHRLRNVIWGKLVRSCRNCSPKPPSSLRLSEYSAQSRFSQDIYFVIPTPVTAFV